MCYWTSKRKHNDGADATHCNLVVLGFLSYREGCGSVWRQGEVFSIQSDGSEFYWRFEGQIKRIILTSTWSFCLPQGSPKIFLEVMWLWVFRVVTISSSAGGKIALGSMWESVHHVSKDYENRTLEMGPEMLAQNSHNTIALTWFFP